MCDKLQSSKDGNVDLCHRHLTEYSSPRSVQYSSSSSISSNSITSNRKQRKYHGKDKSAHSRTEPDESNKPLNGRRCVRSYQDRHFRTGGSGSSPGQSSPKQGRQERKKIKESGFSGRCGYEEGSESGKKKVPPTSLNHLLNFTVTSSERQYSGRGGMPPILRHRRRNTSHSYNKEEFLQANCQFVVSASGDYAVHFRDPDKLVEWERIEQVRLFCHEIPSCPICLYPPRTAKITRCGHVYCWSCLLHYLSLGEKKWSKCPICNESIYRKAIKSVAALSSPQYEVGDSISMKLMVRGKGTTEVCTRADWNSLSHGMLTIEDSRVNQFVKLVSATPSQVLSLITGPERMALENQLAELAKEEASEQCFIEAALQDLKVRESGLTASQTVHLEVERMVAGLSVSLGGPFPSATSTDSTSHHTTCTWASFSEPFEDPFVDLFVDPGEDSTDSVRSVEDNGGTEEGKEGTTPGHSNSGQNSEATSASSECSPRSCSSESSSVGGDALPSQATKGDLVYFYQASDGQHFYMHPVNVKCLSKEYGGLEYCPDEVTATIVEIEQFTMSEEVRGRYKSTLSHLPLTCELGLCELELRPPVLSQDTLDYFSTEIYRRKQKRVKKKKDERRREKRAEAKNSLPEPFFRVPSALELTPEKFHDFLSLASSPALMESGSPEAAQSNQTRAEDDAGGCERAQVVGTSPVPSFAQALQGKWSVKVSPRDTPVQQSDVGTPANDTREQDETSVPSLQDAFNEAFQSASESVWAAHKAPGGKPGNKTAKKGRKKLVLFSTGGSRGAS